jgi:hypothetical protein
MTRITQRITKLVAVAATIILIAIPSAASAVAAAGTSLTAVQQQHLSNIITRGDQEITRRLAQLNKLSSLITASKHLTASDKTTLSGEVTTEISGLTTLKTKLDAETTVAGAGADAKSIITDYRVYALITPKVWLIKTADDQQTAEAKLSALITKFQTRITAAKSQGKEVTALQTALDDMTTQVKNSQAICSGIEAKVLPLQPTDFDSDHTILTGDAAQLKTAHAANEAAYTDAKTIVTGLKNL